MSAPLSLAPASVPFKRPLVSLWTAVEVLDRSSAELLALIEEGKLRFAWNIAGRRTRRRLIRILSQSLVEFQSGQPAPNLSAPDDFQRAVKLIFPAVSHAPGGAITVRATTIVKRLSVGSDHVLHLVDQGELRVCKGAVRRPGPNGSPEIEFGSVVEFLTKRRLL